MEVDTVTPANVSSLSLFYRLLLILTFLYYFLSPEWLRDHQSRRREPSPQLEFSNESLSHDYHLLALQSYTSVSHYFSFLIH
jgi:hypothetical protein